MLALLLVDINSSSNVLSNACHSARANRNALHDNLPLQEKALQKENDILTKNISRLFNTAKEEIARKDKWIVRLRKDVESLEAELRQNGCR